MPTDSAEPMERRYALTRVTAGDYLLPSNDAQALWRVERYEDGPSYGLTDWPRDRVLWRIWRWRGVIEPGAHADLDDWDRWEEYAGGFNRRAEAINAALAA